MSRSRLSPDGGSPTLGFAGEIVTIQVAAFGPDVLPAGAMPADGLPDPDALRAAGGEMALMRVVDVE